jgi:hypothetical protein
VHLHTNVKKSIISQNAQEIVPINGMFGMGPILWEEGSKKIKGKQCKGNGICTK